MLKKYRKTLIITTIITMLPVLAGIILWDKLPEKFPIHFNAAGEVDGWSSKAVGVFVMPLILVAVQWLCALGSLKMDPKANNLNEKVMGLVLWIIRARSLNDIARRRGIRNAWLAWVPVGCAWVRTGHASWPATTGIPARWRVKNSCAVWVRKSHTE